MLTWLYGELLTSHPPTPANNILRHFAKINTDVSANSLIQSPPPR